MRMEVGGYRFPPSALGCLLALHAVDWLHNPQRKYVIALALSHQ